MTAAATEFINLNSVDPATANVFICEEAFPGTPPYSPAHDPTLCPIDPDGPGPLAREPYRKFVRVEALLDVSLAFLPIVGWNNVAIHADATSEAASLDLVLTIDTSASMSYDLCRDVDGFGVPIDNDEDGVANDCDGIGAVNATGPDNNGDGRPDWDSDPVLCNANRFLSDDVAGDDPGPPPDGDREDDCHPFTEVRDAAEAMLTRMYRPDPGANLMYDRMSIVTYAREGRLEISLAAGPSSACGPFCSGDNFTDVLNVIRAIEVQPEPWEVNGCLTYTLDPGDIRGCTNTNTEEGLLIAGDMFGDPNADGVQSPGEIRQEAVWIVILLSDGGANAARASVVANPLLQTTWICPNAADINNPTWVAPACKDEDGASRHISTNFWYDPDDMARDNADFVGCPDANAPQPADCPAPGQGAVIFTIGLGDLVTASTGCWAGYGGGCDPDQGEQLLRYVAGVGDDGDPNTSGDPDTDDPCNGAPVGTDCGNYYFSPTGAGLRRVFEAIASRIFTRLTH
jgi:hypothetical protein